MSLLNACAAASRPATPSNSARAASALTPVLRRATTFMKRSGGRAPVAAAIETVRGPESDLLIEELEPLRHHADDPHRRVVDLHGAADDRGIAAEARLPEAMREDGNRRRIRTIVLRREETAVQRTHAEQREELPRHDLDVQPRRFADARERHGAAAPRREVLEGAAFALPVHPVGGGVPAARAARLDGAHLELRHVLVDHHQLVAVRIGQGPQQELIDDGEDRGVAADTEREREHDGGGEAGTLAQAARHVTHVAHQAVEPARRSDVVTLFLQPQHAAEPRLGGAAGIAGIHPAALVFARELIDVEGHLAIHVAIARVPGEDGEQAADESRRTRHGQAPCSMARRTRVTAFDSRCQLSSSASAAARPLRVSL